MIDSGIEIDFLPVERGNHSGDCIVMRYGNLYEGKDKQSVVVIDGGYSDTKDLLKEHLNKYYNCIQDGKYIIDIMILTHPDQDHIEGLVKIVEDDDFIIKHILTMIPWKVMSPEWFKDGRITEKSLEKKLEDAFKLLTKLVDLADSEEIRTNIVIPTRLKNPYHYRGAVFTSLGPSLDFYKTCIANCDKTPKQADYVPYMESASFSNEDREEKYIPGHIEWNYEETTSEINESSYIFIFEFCNWKILFCGDVGKKGLKMAIDTANKIGVSLDDLYLIKMPHHGSRKNVTPELMDNFSKGKPFCFITCKPNDEGHHPSKRLVNMLKEKGFKVYSTSGSIIRISQNAPDRDWRQAIMTDTFPTMDKI